jgi:ribosome-associated protein
MDRERIRAWLRDGAEMSFSRSSGPGGQNVNKVNSKVSVFVPIVDMPGLTDAERGILIEKLSGRLSEGSVLVIQVQDSRSQLENRALAVERVMEIIERALKRDKPRKPTRPTRASKERRLLSKRIVKQKKSGRSEGRRGGDD